MKLASLFSGGKDSVYSIYLAKKMGHEISCLVSILSKNKDSYMFHTPSISKVEKQAEVLNIPLIIKNTEGKKEEELKDLEKAILEAKEKYNIDGIVTGAIKSVYQVSRIGDICNKLGLKCINPLWQKSELEYLSELIRNKFKVILVGVFAYPFNESWLLREIDSGFLFDIKKLNEKYDIHVAGEGGEFESFVLDCPLYSRPLKIVDKEFFKEGENSFRAEIEVV